MKLISVNIGQRRPNPNPKASQDSRHTGIYKEPQSHPVRIAQLGLEGDTIGNPKVHGGPDQAVYIYGTADYDWWSGQLGRSLEPGAFGENLTIGELESAAFAVGDRFHIGGVALEVTAPRIPCHTLAAKMNDWQFIQRFKDAERPGFYCRVLVEGSVQTGEVVNVEPYRGETITILEMFRGYYSEAPDPDFLRRGLLAPTPRRWREKMAERYQR